MVIRPLLSNLSVVGLFLIPMITMRLFAEEKRTGTIELLVTSPLTDLEIIGGKFVAALVLYASMLGVSFAERPAAVRLRKAGLRADPGRLPRVCCSRRAVACWRSGPGFPPAPRTRSSRESPPSGSACCCGCCSGFLPLTAPPPDR